MVSKLVLAGLIGLQLYLLSTLGIFWSEKLVDEDLQSYVNSYYTKLNDICPEKKNSHTNNYHVHFSEGEHYWVGLCSIRSTGYEIEIDSDYWRRASLDDREQLISHELSHCVLDMGHSSDPHNYMYFQTNKITDDVFHEQLRVDMEAFCNG